MSASEPRFIPLLDLASVWAEATGLTEEMMLRRLCDWAVGGGFPEGTFVDDRGEPIDALDIYASCRIIQTANGAKVRIGRNTYLGGGRLGQRLLGTVLVDSAGLMIFCEKIGARLPGQTSRGPLGLFRRAEPAIAPPPCEHAAKTAVAIEENRHARTLIVSLRRLLDDLRGNSRQPRSFRSPDAPMLADGQNTSIGNRPIAAMPGPLHTQYQSERWADLYQRTEAAIARATEPGLREALRQIEEEWETTRAEASIKPLEDSGDHPSVRLQIYRGRGVVMLDGEEKSVAEQPLKLLLLLAEHAALSPDFVPPRTIVDRVWGASAGKVSRPIPDLARDLREAIGKEGKSLIPNRTNRGYRLNLFPPEISIRD